MTPDETGTTSDDRCIRLMHLAHSLCTVEFLRLTPDNDLSNTSGDRIYRLLLDNKTISRVQTAWQLNGFWNRI